jgi:hypothetical protein
MAYADTPGSRPTSPLPDSHTAGLLLLTINSSRWSDVVHSAADPGLIIKLTMHGGSSGSLRGRSNHSESGITLLEDIQVGAA